MEDFTFGYIKISRKKFFRHTNREEFLKFVGDNYESSSSEDEESIYYDKIVINGFILATENDNGDILEINIVCSNIEHKGLGETLVNLVLNDCEEEGFDKCVLETPYDYLIAYYGKFGFEYVGDKENGNYYMELLLSD